MAKNFSDHTVDLGNSAESSAHVMCFEISAKFNALAEAFSA